VSNLETELSSEGQSYPHQAARPRAASAAANQNLALSAIGAAVGAGFGGLIWFGMAYVSGMEFAMVAALVGAMAGWGAVWLGKTRSEAVGCIAAVIGVIGIFIASYAAFHHGMHVELAKAQFRNDFYYAQTIENPDFDGMSAPEKEALFEQAYQGAVATAPGYWGSLKEDPLGLIMMILFGGFGVYYAFRVGSGITGEGSFW
jgi:hypothetical protein